MKKIFALTAVSMMLAATTAFASCPLKADSCSMKYVGIPTGAAAPVTYVAAPVVQRNCLPPCNTCNTCNAKPAEKGFFSKIFTPVKGIYDATLGQIFTDLY